MRDNRLKSSEKVLLNKLQQVLPQMVALTKKRQKISFDYDQEADVMYISFQKPQQATDSEMINNDIVVHKRGRDIVGVTVFHASSFRS